MIWESHPWRDELLRVADELEQWTRAVDWDDDLVAFEIERSVMVSAYAIRKLLEARKLSDSTTRTRVRVKSHPLIDRVPDLMNWDRLDEFYDFERVQTEELTLERLCNQLIHSFIFMREGAAEEEGGDPVGLAGFIVASDRTRTSNLYRVDVDALIDLLRLVGNEEVVSTRMTRDASGQWQVSNMTADDMDRAEPGWRTQIQKDAE